MIDHNGGDLTMYVVNDRQRTYLVGDLMSVHDTAEGTVRVVRVRDTGTFLTGLKIWPENLLGLRVTDERPDALTESVTRTLPKYCNECHELAVYVRHPSGAWWVHAATGAFVSQTPTRHDVNTVGAQ